MLAKAAFSTLLAGSMMFAGLPAAALAAQTAQAPATQVVEAVSAAPASPSAASPSVASSTKQSPMMHGGMSRAIVNPVTAPLSADCNPASTGKWCVQTILPGTTISPAVGDISQWNGAVYYLGEVTPVPDYVETAPAGSGALKTGTPGTAPGPFADISYQYQDSAKWNLKGIVPGDQWLYTASYQIQAIGDNFVIQAIPAQGNAAATAPISDRFGMPVPLDLTLPTVLSSSPYAVCTGKLDGDLGTEPCVTVTKYVYVEDNGNPGSYIYSWEDAKNASSTFKIPLFTGSANLPGAGSAPNLVPGVEIKQISESGATVWVGIKYQVDWRLGGEEDSPTGTLYMDEDLFTALSVVPAAAQVYVGNNYGGGQYPDGSAVTPPRNDSAANLGALAQGWQGYTTNRNWDQSPYYTNPGDSFGGNLITTADDDVTRTYTLTNPYAADGTANVYLVLDTDWDDPDTTADICEAVGGTWLAAGHCKFSSLNKNLCTVYGFFWVNNGCENDYDDIFDLTITASGVATPLYQGSISNFIDMNDDETTAQIGSPITVPGKGSVDITVNVSVDDTFYAAVPTIDISNALKRTFALEIDMTGSYTLTCYANNGINTNAYTQTFSATPGSTLPNCDTVLGVNKVAPANQTFSSYNSKADGSGVAFPANLAAFLTNPGDLTYYARWSNVYYPLTCNTNYPPSASLTNQPLSAPVYLAGWTVGAGTSQTQCPNPTSTPAGYTLGGWVVLATPPAASWTPATSDYMQNMYDGVTGTLPVPTNGTGLQAYAYWVPNTYTLTCNTNYPASASLTDQNLTAPVYQVGWTVGAGATQTQCPNPPASPEVPGYTFGGWVIASAKPAATWAPTPAQYMQNAFNGNPATAVLPTPPNGIGLTAYAYWIPSAYSIQCNANYFDGVAVVAQYTGDTGATGEVLRAYTGSTPYVPGTSMVQADPTIEPQAPPTVRCPIPTADQTPTGYGFAGWTTHQYPLDTPLLDSNLSMNKYGVDVAGATAIPTPQQVPGADDEVVGDVTYPPAQCGLGGVWINPEQVNDDGTRTCNPNVLQAFAVWRPTVTYDANGGQFNQITPQPNRLIYSNTRFSDFYAPLVYTPVLGAQNKADQPTRVGYTFTGWDFGTTLSSQEISAFDQTTYLTTQLTGGGGFALASSDDMFMSTDAIPLLAYAQWEALKVNVGNYVIDPGNQTVSWTLSAKNTGTEDEDNVLMFIIIDATNPDSWINNVIKALPQGNLQTYGLDPVTGQPRPSTGKQYQNSAELTCAPDDASCATVGNGLGDPNVNQMIWQMGTIKAGATVNLTITIPLANYLAATGNAGSFGVTAILENATDLFVTPQGCLDANLNRFDCVNNPTYNQTNPNGIDSDTDQWDTNTWQFGTPNAKVAVSTAKQVTPGTDLVTWTVTAANLADAKTGGPAIGSYTYLIVDGYHPEQWANNYAPPSGTSLVCNLNGNPDSTCAKGSLKYFTDPARPDKQLIIWDTRTILPGQQKVLTISVPASELDSDGDVCVTAYLDAVNARYTLPTAAKDSHGNTRDFNLINAILAGRARPTFGGVTWAAYPAAKFYDYALHHWTPRETWRWDAGQLNNDNVSKDVDQWDYNGWAPAKMQLTWLPTPETPIVQPAALQLARSGVSPALIGAMVSLLTGSGSLAFLRRRKII